MLTWIVAAIIVYFVGLMIPLLIVVMNDGIDYGVGPRDTPPRDNVILGRARRAHENLKENLIVFLALAILSMMQDGGPPQLALTGAMLFVLARIAYIPLYLAGIKWVRSLAFGVGLLGLVLMLVALF